MSSAPKSFNPLLRYEDLCISFGSGRREKFAVHHLDLEIGVGERVAFEFAEKLECFDNLYLLVAVLSSQR